MAVAEDMVYVYEREKRKEICSFKTALNAHGICALVSVGQDTCLLAFPDEVIGDMRLVWICTKTKTVKKEQFIKAHESHIRCFALSLDGSLLATASEKGTIVRLFYTETGEKKTEFRRGSLANEIYSICFSNRLDYLACVSSGGTLHVFLINLDKLSGQSSSNGWWDYFSSYSPTESISKSIFKLRQIEGVAVCAFDSSDESILLCTHNGEFICVKFDWNFSIRPPKEDPTDKYEILF